MEKMIFKTFMVLKNGILKQIRENQTRDAIKRNKQMKKVRKFVVAMELKRISQVLFKNFAARRERIHQEKKSQAAALLLLIKMRWNFKKHSFSREERYRNTLRQNLTFHCNFMANSKIKIGAQTILHDFLKMTAKQQELQIKMTKFTNRIVKTQIKWHYTYRMNKRYKDWLMGQLNEALVFLNSIYLKNIKKMKKTFPV